uniref:Phage integrase, N-terminal SAM-like domain n=1 Tax=Candidatus Kentrum sp. UNK TaxID=2126344 RepID=A0A451AL48_9GAMM|nr:MAG: Phage integrase, N-terminal SAM-like domain [Candidatus Kentron sp. UNK]VFK72197.1 MAG: Phage integrase, N-terminal SAM-like domain [Candidatus Kentron sp. UNK]
MTSVSEGNFNHNYQTHLKHLGLKGLQPNTIDAYVRAIRRIGAYFDYRINDLSEARLTNYFTAVLDSQSWRVVKHDLYGLEFYCRYLFATQTGISSFFLRKLQNRAEDLS